MLFLDRHDAGRRLAAELEPLARERPVIVALPRGGVPVAFEVARALRAPLDILAVRKLGAPGNPELGVGAVAEDGTGVLDPHSSGMLGMTEATLETTIAVPVGSSQAVSLLAEEADRVVCLEVPPRLLGVGMWYRDFTPVSDEQVVALLAEAGEGESTRPAGTEESSPTLTTYPSAL
jgi:predicted phosphoribosyltransferase